MNTKATIDTSVLRPFFFRGVQYKEKDIFEYNPNANTVGTRQQFYFIRNGRVKQFEEKDCLYVSLRDNRQYFDKTYSYGDIVEVPEDMHGKALLYIKRGQIKKIHKDRLDEFKKLISKDDEKIEEILEENVNETVEENIDSKVTDIDVETLEYESCNNLSRLAKNVNIKAKELKYQIKQKLDIEYNSYTQKITEEEFKKIIKLLKRKNVKWMR